MFELTTEANKNKIIRRYQVNFSKRFLDGMLEGKLYHDHAAFATLDEAMRFADHGGKKITPCCGTGDYKMEDVSIIDLYDYE